MNLRGWIFSLLLTLAIAAPASADVIYDSGAPDFRAAPYGITSFYTAGDFSFNTTTMVNSVTFWSAENASAYRGSIFYSIFKDVSGKPSETMLVPWTEGSSLVRTFLPSAGTDLWGLSTYQYVFDIAPFTAAAGETYWLSIHNGDIAASYPDYQMYWRTTGAAGTQGSPYFYIQNPIDGIGWHLVSDSNPAFVPFEVAFQLSGTGSTVVPTPEPATMLLFGLGGLALPFARRLRKKA